MYAQLCKRLNDCILVSEPDGTRTFKRLLLNSCREEFENRGSTSQQNENSNGNETDSDSKFMAKRKMLGNVKFIGELGKVEMLHDSTLLKCIERLVVGKKKQSISDQAEDLECLCHLLKTCGKILDTNKAKGIMDQCFVRLATILESGRMPTRIRFLIQDVIEMRNNNWVPRKIGQTPDVPRTIQQIREDAYRDGCVYLPQDNYASAHTLPNEQLLGMLNPVDGMFFEGKSHLSNGKDFFGGSSSMSSFLDGPSSLISYDDRYGRSDYSLDRDKDGSSFSNKMNRNDYDNRRDNGFSLGGRRSPGNNYFDHDQRRNRLSDNRSDYGEHKYMNNKNKDYGNMRYNNSMNGDGRYGDNRYSNSSDSRYHRYGNRSPQNNGHGDDRRYRNDHSQSSRGYNNLSNSYRNDNGDIGNGDINGGERLPPRFKKNLQPGMSKDSEMRLRPQSVSSSMILKPKTPSMLPKSAISKTDGNSPLGENSLVGPTPSRIAMQQKEPMIIKQGSLDKGRKDKNKGNKGPTREEVFSKMDTLLNDLLNTHQNPETSLEAWKELDDWLPSKMNQTAMTSIFKSIVAKGEKRKLAFDFICCLVKDTSCSINETHCIEALGQLISSKPSNQDSSDKSKKENEISELAAWIITEEFMSLNEYSCMVKGHYPLFLLTLNKLLESLGKDRLGDIFNVSDVSLMDHVRVDDRSEDKMVLILDDHGLTFLAPLLSVRREMSKLLSSGSTDPAKFYQWIIDSVPEEYYKQPEFILALYGLVIENIVTRTTLSPDIDPTQSVDKYLTDKEKELLSSYGIVLQPFVRDNSELQLVAVYAIQVFCNSRNYPKGMLLRCFVNFYEMDIMDEKAFFSWKEDMKYRSIYPGKEKALFQVNSWFTWLEETETEEEDEEEDD
ncbi:eukaryotic translation initiation factor 4 gamma 2 [Lepeophtheirus salmonis]|nr:eukaryotic translation initiation factor 4 gamma 2-like [Lepeophtheirus salmonis]